MVAKADGTVVQTSHYYPFGMSFTEGNVMSTQPYKYSGASRRTCRYFPFYSLAGGKKDYQAYLWGTYTQVLYVLGLKNDLSDVGKDDVLGRKFQDAKLVVGKRAPKK